MKFRLPRRLKYLRKARHWHGHGIHSPFLFYLVTRVIEDKRQYPAYRIIRSLKEKILNQLKERENPCDLLINAASLPDRVSKNKLFKKVELGYRYGKLLLRLINEFKPSSVFLYGPTFGMNLLYLALADQKPSVYVINFRTQERTHLLPEIPETLSFRDMSTNAVAHPTALLRTEDERVIGAAVAIAHGDAGRLRVGQKEIALVLGTMLPAAHRLAEGFLP